MKYKKIIIPGVFVLALLLYGLFADFKNDKYVKIGVTLPLSGNLSMYGESILNGINLAINEQNNSSDPLKIDLIVGNNEGSANKAVSDVNNFVYVDKVSAVYNSFESLGLAAREIVEKTHVPMIMSTTYVLTAKDSPKFTFRDYWNFKNIGNDFNIILKKDSVSSVKILAQNDNSYNDFKSDIVQDGVELGREEKFNYGEKDFRTSLSKLNISSNDNLIVYAFPVEASLIVKQLIELGVKPNRLLITEATEYPIMSDSKSVSYLSEIGAYSYVSSEILDNQDFVSKYKQAYKINPRADSVYAYEDSRMLIGAIKKCDKFEYKIEDQRVCIKDEIKGGFDEFNNINRNVPIVKFGGGRFSVIK